MAVIQTIRNKYGKIAGGIIALALVGFIVSDATSGSLASMFSDRNPNVMEVNGVKIDPKEYSARLKEYEILYTMYNDNRSLDDVNRAQMNEQLINMLVYEQQVQQQCDKLGIRVSDEEKKELVYGANPDPMVRQFQVMGTPIFADPETKQFDPGRVKGFEKELADRGNQIDPEGRVRDQWAAVKAYVQRAALVRKYNSLFGGSVYVPKYQMKRMMAERNESASIRYVRIPYTSVPDAEVKVSDDDIKAYMKKHEAMYYNNEPTRSIEYVSFEIVPSSADTARALTALEDIRTDFENAKDNEAFVNGHSDNLNSYTEAYYNKRTLTSRMADTILTMPVGAVYGPYYENGSYNLVKVTDRKTLPDSVKLRHILVKTKDQGSEVRSDSDASRRIDSAIAAIRAGGSFDTAVLMYSDDEGSKAKGGEYTFTLRDRPGISKEFGDFAFEGKAGESKKVYVSNDNYSGYHYIEILDQKGIQPSSQIALVAKNLVPSDSTINALYAKANEFAGKNTTAAAFDEAAKKDGYDKRIGNNVKITAFNIAGLGPAREVVRWMYDHKVGDISQVFQLGDERYVVAKLTGIQEKGLKELNPADRPMIEQKIRDERKGEILVKKYAGKPSLDAIAAESMQTVEQTDSVTLAGGYVPNLGYEPKVVGYTFDKSFQPNTVSPGIPGQAGVYFITVLSRNSAPLPPDGGMMDQIIAQQRRQQEQQQQNAMEQAMQTELTRQAKVKYYPANF